MINLTNETFKTEIEAHKGLAIVDFFTQQCGPCRAIAPVFAKSEAKHPDVKHAKIEPTDAADVFVNFTVNYVPTFILFRDGKEVDRKGYLTEKDLETWLTTESKKSEAPSKEEPVEAKTSTSNS